MLAATPSSSRVTYIAPNETPWEIQPLPDMDAQTKQSFGTEKDPLHCAFFLKTGSCRFGDRCGKGHPYPTLSPTILLKNMYDGLGMASSKADDEFDGDLETPTALLSHIPS